MKFGVITFPGSNCDQDVLHVLRIVLRQPVAHLWHKDTDLQGVDMVVIPGGFAHGDYLRTGAIARFSPIMASVASHAAKGGYVFGICNGFQILTEAGLLPGALRRNASTLHVCDNQYISPATHNSLLTRTLTQVAYSCPISHGEGNYYCPPDDLKALEDSDQVLFHYCGPGGELADAYNPNGSLHHIAGVMNAGRNVFGMMPHPDRSAELLLGSEDGRRIFESLLA
jgi:phosphoribosylformylglycinamidine synthase subunit PurQ / glutaminase